MTDNQSYEMEYPSSRRLTFDVGRIGREKHHVKALLEVDVTEARSRIRQNRHTGRKISFTAWLIKVIADCVALHPPVGSVNRPKGNKVVVFGDVDISIEKGYRDLFKAHPWWPCITALQMNQDRQNYKLNLPLDGLMQISVFA